MKEIKTTPLVGNPGAAVFQAIQIAPNRMHASSDYHYYPEILQPYGISIEDWHLFTAQFVNANRMTRDELVALTAISVLLQVAFAFGLGPPGFPVAAILSGALMGGPTMYGVKGRRLRRNVRNGNIPDWLVAWNTQYFNPKGLMVGFNLPGRQVQHAAVAPRIRRKSAFAGKYKKPRSQRKATKRSRIVIVNIHDPTPEAGHVPQLESIKISRLYRHIGRVRAVLIPDLSKLDAKIEAKRQAIQAIRQQRLDISMDGAPPEQSTAAGWTIRPNLSVVDTSTESRWRSWFHRKRSYASAAVSSLDGTISSSVSRVESLIPRRASGKHATQPPRMLGSGRIRDATQGVL